MPRNYEFVRNVSKRTPGLLVWFAVGIASVVFTVHSTLSVSDALKGLNRDGLTKSAYDTFAVLAMAYTGWRTAFYGGAAVGGAVNQSFDFFASNCCCRRSREALPAVGEIADPTPTPTPTSPTTV